MDRVKAFPYTTFREAYVDMLIDQHKEKRDTETVTQLLEWKASRDFRLWAHIDDLTRAEHKRVRHRSF